MRSADINDTRGVDGLVDHFLGRVGSHVNRAALSGNRAAVGDGGAEIVAMFVFGFRRGFGIDGKTVQIIAVEIDSERLSGAKRDRPGLGSDNAIVSNAGCEQGDQTAFGRCDSAFIDNAGICFARLIKFIVARFKISIADIAGAGDKPGHVDLRIFTKEYAAAIYEHQLAIGRQGAKNLGWISIGDAVKGNGA